jgi:hypothetical protein
MPSIRRLWVLWCLLGGCEAAETVHLTRISRRSPVTAAPADAAPGGAPSDAPTGDAILADGGITAQDMTPDDLAGGADPEDTPLAESDAREDAGPTPAPAPQARLPARLAIPWVPADGRASELLVPLGLTGEPESWAELVASVSGDARISLREDEVRPASALTLRFAGATALARARATLTLRHGDRLLASAEVHAFAGAWTSPLPTTAWESVSRLGVRHGQGVTVRLATAPFPHPSGPWTDDRVHIFVPDGHRPREATDFVVHFHGHGATIAETLAMHRYREQLWASGGNQVLVLPQGPVEAASGNFGRLMSAPGLVRLLDDVSAILYRDGIALSPEVGDLTLTEHSGGYLATAANLGVETSHGQVVAAVLLDGLYGRSAEFLAFARAGGYLRSNHTAGGGTRANNLAMLNGLGGLATATFSAPTLRDRVAVIWPTTASHHDATWWEQGYAEALRWGTQRSRRGPRVELRSARLVEGSVEVRWLAPDDDDLAGFVVETSPDGVRFDGLALPADRRSARVPLPAGATGLHVRVRTALDGVDAGDTLPSDSVFVAAAPARGGRVLVVDGFDRILDGSFGQLAHGASARVGAALEGADAATNEAVAEGEVALADYVGVFWLLGDESTADHTFTATERAVVEAYLAGGGRLVVSGSEVAWELGGRGVAPSFLATLGAVYRGDDAGASQARGVGPLASLGDVGFGGAGAMYPEDFPDVLGRAEGAVALLAYPDGASAAVGYADRTALVAFPLELVNDAPTLSALLAALGLFTGMR